MKTSLPVTVVGLICGVTGYAVGYSATDKSEKFAIDPNQPISISVQTSRTGEDSTPHSITYPLQPCMVDGNAVQWRNPKIDPDEVRQAETTWLLILGGDKGKVSIVAIAK